ncbi:hypothetical protein M0L20_25615 [Spirosoma sp. RP8]|uniref:Uncharacterized protein n=1 Tax=Spirosoma liriopis TaxID=2937440 RepID=A0ABT0HSW1_9BACT|nr:hypothetical protein [Spirosoma liriopis]MCK8495273.1 hypothetical protein [Spirosoma liriopis]
MVTATNIGNAEHKFQRISLVVRGIKKGYDLVGRSSGARYLIEQTIYLIGYNATTPSCFSGFSFSLSKLFTSRSILPTERCSSGSSFANRGDFADALGLFMLTSFANGLAYILIWIGTSLLYIDLLPLEGIVDKRLVQGLVAIKLTALAGSFLHVWPVLISNTFDLLGVILAWLLLNSLASHQELHEAG